MTARAPIGRLQEQRVLEDLVRDGPLDPRNVREATGLADWEPPTARPGTQPLSETLRELRDEEP